MATSGSVDYSIDRNGIISDALTLLGVIEAGATPETAHITTCSVTLNMLIKHLQTRGANIELIKQAYLFTEPNTSSYTLSSTGSRYTYSYVRTTVDGALSSGATSIVVDSITGISNSDNIGIYQSDGTMHWTTVNGAPSGSTVVITSGITADVDDGAVVYAFTSKADRPMGLVEAYIRDESQVDRPIDVVSRTEYTEYSDKNTDSQITAVYYDSQVSSPKLYTWPQSSDPRHIVGMWVKRTVEDFDASTDTPDLPQEWYMPIVYGLADMAAPKFGIFNQDISLKARELIEQALDYSCKPEAPVEFSVEFS